MSRLEARKSGVRGHSIPRQGVGFLFISCQKDLLQRKTSFDKVAPASKLVRNFVQLMNYPRPLPTYLSIYEYGNIEIVLSDPDKPLKVGINEIDLRSV